MKTRLTVASIALLTMTSAAYENTKIRVHAIAISKPLDEPPAKVVLKRRHAAAMEAPVCARLSDTHSLVCAPNDAPDARWKFGFANGGLRRVADGKDSKKKMEKTPQKKTVYEWEQVNTQEAIWFGAK